MSTEDRGVNYRLLDPFKVRAQQSAMTTDGNITRLGLKVVRETRGESAFCVRRIGGEPVDLVGCVIETLGTKSLVADAVREMCGRTFYDHLAQDTVAMVVNDMATLAVVPVVIGCLVTAGTAEWFADTERSDDFITGWTHACNLARAVYGPGESAALSELIAADGAVLSGFSFGVADPRAGFIGRPVADDAIVLLASSGIHANGLTNARSIAGELTGGYATKLTDGRTLGESLLDPTPVYCPIVEDSVRGGAAVHYAVNITGHGWRKLMRSEAPLTYVIEDVPSVPPVLEMLVAEASLSSVEAYGTYNMGAGFAVFVSRGHTQVVLEAAAEHGIEAMVAGHVEASAERRVVIRPLGIEYGPTALDVR